MGDIYLHDLLSQVLEKEYPEKKQNCYYEPPANIKMDYPCIIYNMDNTQRVFADNKTYNLRKKYTVTLIDPDPDSNLPYYMMDIPYTSFDRVYSTEGLSHFVFSLYSNLKRFKEE